MRNDAPFFARGRVFRGIDLSIWVIVSDPNLHLANPGQFFMLRRANSEHILGRPISVYTCTHVGDEFSFQFVVQEKGAGSWELLELKNDEAVELLGPLGNGFPLPDESEKVALVGGGIGIAPLVHLSEVLGDDYNFDFYACFKNRAMNMILPARNANNLIITTESGLDGKKGMLPDVLTADVIMKNGYKKIYACGPTPMLEYVQQISEEAGVESFLSLENFMACGVGACLGCTIKTRDGRKKCCKDGPVFKGSEVFFGKPEIAVLRGIGDGKDVDLSVEIAGEKFKNPVIAASGTFGFGTEYEDFFDVSELGGIVSKGLTLEQRSGNSGRRVFETPGGMMNSIGLENPGIPHFCMYELGRMMALDTVQIANLSGSSTDTYVQGAELLDKTNIPMIELNISCPNVKAGGMAFGLDPNAAYNITAAVREVTRKPLIVKLSPNAPDIISVANAVRSAGANALSLVNTFQALAIDVETGLPVFKNAFAGLSGPAIKPLALRIVYQVAKEMSKLPEKLRIPIIGLGGITDWRDAVEFILCGCSAIQVGTATFMNPYSMVKIVRGIEDYMKAHQFERIEDFRGLSLDV